MKALVAYFSAESGRTANVAKSLAAAIGADVIDAKLMNSIDKDTLKRWVEGL